MIGSLQRRVFWSILLSAAGVLLAILLAFNILKLAQTASKANAILDSGGMLLEPGGGPPRGKEEDRGGRDKFELIRSVSKDELGAILLASGGSISARIGCAEQMDGETLSKIAAAALSDADGQGRTGSWRYRTAAGESGLGVILLNASSLRRENWQTAFLSLAFFAAACGLFALLARFLTRLIVEPVEENVQMQKRFVADASHELKTPLTVIDANAAVLEQSVGQNRWLDYIKEQTGRMSGLVNELLQLSDLEEARETGAAQQYGPFDAAEAVLSAALPFESVAFERGVTLDTDVPDALEAHGSRKELEQLASILIDNAVKHSPSGGTVKIVLTGPAARRGRKAEAAMELRVSNSGDRIPPEALPHIFDRFYRADEARTRKEGSYGLGLAIAKALVEKHEGSISVISRDGLTEFTVLLPIG